MQRRARGRWAGRVRGRAQLAAQQTDRAPVLQHSWLACPPLTLPSLSPLTLLPAAALPAQEVIVGDGDNVGIVRPDGINFSLDGKSWFCAGTNAVYASLVDWMSDAEVLVMMEVSSERQQACGWVPLLLEDCRCRLWLPPPPLPPRMLPTPMLLLTPASLLLPAPAPPHPFALPADARLLRRQLHARLCGEQRRRRLPEDAHPRPAGARRL